jgi:lysine-N-methylase
VRLGECYVLRVPDVFLNTTDVTTRMVRPVYAERFACIGPACEDTCCIGWSVHFDQAAWEKYQTLPAGPLRSLIEISVERLPLDAPVQPPGAFARVKMEPGRACPLLNEQKLCQIQVEHGEEFLSRTCATYPRIVHKIDDVEEKALSLSCPEAARLVLLTPNLLAVHANDTEQMPWAEEASGLAEARVSLLGHFWPIREFVLWQLMNREYPLWQRLFLLGIFVRRLDALARGELKRTFSEVLRDFKAAVDVGSLRASMESIQPDLPLQLEMVLRLASLQLPRSFVGERFQQTARAFAAGVGNGPGATMASLAERYADAHERYYAPFFAARPHILENLLINGVFRMLFPFGHTAGKLHAEPDMAREFALLATQFALIKGLLIGVAGFCGGGFSEEQVVFTVQAASKHFEHHPQFLDEAHAVLVSCGLDNVRGLTMLVRN